MQTGGEVEIWVSKDGGQNWVRKRSVTDNSAQNHTYVRRPEGAKDPFYSFWADGNPKELSKSFLYFTDSKGKKVYQLPYEMNTEFAKPMPIDQP